MYIARCILIALLFASAAGAQQMAITIDDLPSHGDLPPGQTRLEVAQSILSTLKASGLPPVYGFVNGARMEREPDTRAVLNAWRDAGEPLANHSWSHPDINERSASEFEADVAKNEPLLKELMGQQDWHWFRYPYLHEGDTLAKRRAVRTWLAAHKYRVAQVNMDFEDYLWNAPYARCVARHDTAAIAKLHDNYLGTAQRYQVLFRQFSKLVYGRDIKYVLLMHIGAFDAKMLPDLLALYRADGFAFISLEEAQQDPAYRDDPDLALPEGGALLEQLMTKRKLAFPANSKPYQELEALCR